MSKKIKKPSNSKKVLIVSSFSKEGYGQYGKEFLNSMIKNWPIKKGQLELACYYHSPFPCEDSWEPDKGVLPEKEGVTYTSLDNIPGFLELKKVFLSAYSKKFPNAEGVVPWQHDVPKFVNKVIALGHASFFNKDDFDWIVWLDADTVTKKEVPVDFLDGILKEEADVVRLGRKDISYSETSFVGFKTNDKGLDIIKKLNGIYASHDYFGYSEFHDGFIFERILNAEILSNDLRALNLTPDVKGLDAFSTSPLAEFMVHNKGNKKEEGGATRTATPLPPKHLKGNPHMPYGGEFKKHHPNASPLVVHPTDSVDTSYITENIKENLKIIPKWLSMCKENDDTIIVCSGGPSLDQFLPKIKEKMQEGGVKVMCVKHAYPRLIKAGIIPDYCVALDPREVEGTSTIGHVRKDLYLEPEPSNTTKFFVASMTHPSVTKLLLDNKKDVWGWHALNDEVIKLFQKEKELFTHIEGDTLEGVPVGTCSAIRGIALMQYIGYKNFILTGFDSSIDEEKAKSSKKKIFRCWLPSMCNDYNISILKDEPSSSDPVGGRAYWTTGEFVALYQDFLGAIPLLFRDNKRTSLETWLSKDTLIGEGWSRYERQKNTEKEKNKAIEKHRNTLPDIYEFLNS